MKRIFALLGVFGVSLGVAYSEGHISVLPNKVDVLSGDLKMQVEFLRKFNEIVEYPALWTELKMAGDDRSAGLISIRLQAEDTHISPATAVERSEENAVAITRGNLKGFAYEAVYTPMEGNAVNLDVRLEWKNSSVPPRVLFAWLAGQSFDEVWFRDQGEIRRLSISNGELSAGARDEFDVAALSEEQMVLVFFNSNSGFGYGMASEGVRVSLQLKEQLGNRVLVEFFSSSDDRDSPQEFSLVFFSGNERENLEQLLRDVRVP